MSTVFQQLISRSLGTPSTESIEVEKVEGQGPKGDELVDAKIADLPQTKDNADEGDDTVHDLVEAMLEENKKMEEKQKDFEEGGRVHASLESLLVGTLDTYGANGMNEQALALYRVSVESALTIAGLNIPAATMVPSFEAADTQLVVAEKVETKGKGILKTIIDWIVKAFKYIGQALVKFKELFTTNKKKVAARAASMVATLKGKTSTATPAAGKEEDAGKEGGEEKPGTGVAVVKEIKVSDLESKIMSRGGTITNLGEASKAIKTNYEKAMRSWGTAFQSIIDMPAVSGNTDPVQALVAINKALSSKVGNGLKEDLNLNEELVLKPGAESAFPMLGASVSVATQGDAKGGSIDIPNKATLISLIEDIEKELLGQSAAEKAMEQAATEVTKRATEYQAITANDKSIDGLDVNKSTRNLMSATSIFARGIAMAGTSYVTSYNTLLNVMQRATEHVQ